MKKSMFRYSIAMLLAILIALSLFSFASCGDSADEGTSDATAAVVDPGSSEDETTAGHDFHFKDYNGQTLTVFMRSRNLASYNSKYVIGESGDVAMDAAMEKRNLQVEEAFKCNLAAIEIDAPADSLLKDFESGTAEYQLMLERRSSMTKLGLQGVLGDFNSLDLDLTTPWWDANCAKNFAINGKLYAMANDVSIARISHAYFVYFSKEVLENYNLTSPYDYVEKNQWTLDNFLTMCQSVRYESDTELGVRALSIATTGGNANFVHLLYGCGVHVTDRDADGNLISAIDTDLEKIDTLLDKMRHLFNKEDLYCVCNNNYSLAFDKDNNSAYANDSDHVRGLFAADHFLFYQGTAAVSGQFADMAKGFGLVPNPKANTDQEAYFSKVDGGALIWGLSNVNNYDKEFVANVFDYWAYASSDTVIPAFYDLTVKMKRASDSTAAKMLDLIKNSIVYEVADILDAGISTPFVNALSGNMASIWAEYKPTQDSKLKELNNIH